MSDFKNGFDTYACEGDTITTEADGFEITARIVRDDTVDRPDERDDGFWPSRDPKDAGYVYPERFDEEMKKAQRTMEAWKNDEWFYVGVVLSVARRGVVLDKHAVSLWGIECNHPYSSNEYLTQVATELLPEALKVGKHVLKELYTSGNDAPGLRSSLEG